MGQRHALANKKQSITPDIEVFLLKYFPHYTFIRSLSNGMFFKTALVQSEPEGFPLIVRIYFKQDFAENDKVIYEAQLSIMKEYIQQITPNTVYNNAPILQYEDHPMAGMLIRQFFAYNLRERIYLMPYLTIIEKKWLSFQLLFAVRELHLLKKCHGDIKLDNVLMTSLSSVYLSDVSPFKPASIISDDMASYTYYFGANSKNLKSCCLAPERLVVSRENTIMEHIYDTKPEMDIFSVGAVIAELFMEESVFDYTKLLNYKTGNFNLKESLSSIKDPKLISLLMKMLALDPSSRIKLEDCIAYFVEEICPVSIPKYFLHMNALISIRNYTSPDMIIGIIYKHWKQIWKILFGLYDTIPILQNILKFSIVNKMICDTSFNEFQPDKTADSSFISLRGFSSLIDVYDLNSLYQENELSNDVFTKNDNKDSLFILLPYIFNTMYNLKYESTLLIALEMLKCFALKVPDLTKIQYISPYFVKIIKKKKQAVVCRSYALHSLIEILYSIDYYNLLLPTSDYHYFDEYIFPMILGFVNRKDLYENMNNGKKKDRDDISLILEFEKIIDVLIDLEDKFLNVVIKSRIQNLNEIIQKHPELKEKKKLEIYESYDVDLKEFKMRLFKAVENLVIRSEIEILQMIIIKFPQLLNFFGQRDTDNLSKLLIDYFNKKEWIIQREMIKTLPPMIGILGESNLYDFILLCFEGLISKCRNELLLYESLITLKELLTLEYLSLMQVLPFIDKVLPYLLHPNICIRNASIDFYSLLISKISKEEIICHVYEPLSKYLNFPLNNITSNHLYDNAIPRISRVVYQMEVCNVENHEILNIIDEDSTIDLIKMIIDREKSSVQVIKFQYDNNVFIRKTPSKLEDLIKKEFKKFRIQKEKEEEEQKCIHTKEEEDHSFEKSFLCKIISFLSCLHNFSFPQITSRDDLNFFSQNGNFLAQELFKINYYFKALGISAKIDLFNIIVEDDETIKNSISYPIIDLTKINTLPPWRPQGQLLTTIYNNSIPIEKLLTFDNSIFTSIDSEGGIILWKLTDSKHEGEMNCEAISSQNTKYPIYYNKTIIPFEKEHVVYASKNHLYKFSIESIEDPALLVSFKEDKDILCAITGKNESEQSIIFVTQNGILSIYDHRMDRIASYCDLSIEKGMVSSMSLSKKKDSIYIGTLGGHILSYDFRLNSVKNSFKYYDNTPIIGIDNYNPSKGKEHDLYAYNQNSFNNDYLLIWTGASDHEIGLWNMDILHCDMLFKVNTIYGFETQPLTLTIPSMIKESKAIMKDQMYQGLDSYYTKSKQIQKLETYFENFNEYTHIYKSNQIKGLLINNRCSDYYKDSSQRLTKLINIYEGQSTVQKILQPKVKTFEENLQYFLSAGNDMTIRYWDIAKESVGNERKSYIINAPNPLSQCVYSRSVYDNTVILQSNEYFNKSPKKDMAGLSSYHNFNGTTLHLSVQNEFHSSMDTLKYCTKIADASHKSVISDLLPMSIEGNHYLISSSFDGAIKVWK